MSNPQRRPAQKLSKERLISAALELIDTEGTQKLTMRRLASAVDVSPMALYWHFANKDELLDGIGDALAQGLDLSAVNIRDPWDTRLTQLLTTLISALSRHPEAAELTVRRMLYTGSGRRVAELGLQALHDAGLDDETALLAGRYALRTAISVTTESLFTGIDVKTDRAAALSAEFDSKLDTTQQTELPMLHRFREQTKEPTAASAYQKVAIDIFVSGIRNFPTSEIKD